MNGKGGGSRVVRGERGSVGGGGLVVAGILTERDQTEETRGDGLREVGGLQTRVPQDVRVAGGDGRHNGKPLRRVNQKEFVVGRSGLRSCKVTIGPKDSSKRRREGKRRTQRSESCLKRKRSFGWDDQVRPPPREEPTGVGLDRGRDSNRKSRMFRVQTDDPPRRADLPWDVRSPYESSMAL